MPLSKADEHTLKWLEKRVSQHAVMLAGLSQLIQDCMKRLDALEALARGKDHDAIARSGTAADETDGLFELV